MRLLHLLAGAGGAFATSMEGSSIAGVVTLLENLLKNAEKESKETAAVYDKVACECRDTMRDQTAIFEAAQKEIDRLSAIKEELAAESKDLAKKISKRNGVKADMEAVIKADYAVEAKATGEAGQVTVNYAEENAAGRRWSCFDKYDLQVRTRTSIFR